MPLGTGFLPCFPRPKFALIRPCGKSGPSAVVKPHHRLRAYAAMRHLGHLGIPAQEAVQHRRCGQNEMAGTKPAMTELVLRRYLLQGRNDRTETHFLGKAMCGPHLLLVERLDERAGRRGKPMDGRAVERNLHDTLADATH